MIFRDPERPVKTTNLSLGISRFISFKLCSFAPFIIILSFIFIPPMSLLETSLKKKYFLHETLYNILFLKTRVW